MAEDCPGAAVGATAALVEARRRTALTDLQGWKTGKSLPPVAPPCQRFSNKHKVKPMPKALYAMEQRRANRVVQWERLRRTARMFPHVILSPGPKATPCPVHPPEDCEWVYRIDSPYWQQKPLCEHEECWCGVRMITATELAGFRLRGIPKQPGRAVLENGVPTGHIEWEMAPLRGIR